MYGKFTFKQSLSPHQPKYSFLTYHDFLHIYNIFLLILSVVIRLYVYSSVPRLVIFTVTSLLPYWLIQSSLSSSFSLEFFLLLSCTTVCTHVHTHYTYTHTHIHSRTQWGAESHISRMEFKGVLKKMGWVRSWTSNSSLDIATKITTMKIFEIEGWYYFPQHQGRFSTERIFWLENIRIMIIDLYCLFSLPICYFNIAFFLNWLFSFVDFI